MLAAKGIMTAAEFQANATENEMEYRTRAFMH
jgi:hypothetical protein